MFACIANDDDNDTITGYARGGGKRLAEQEDEIINKVLEEGLRLKKKCKLLTTQLSDVEALRSLEQKKLDDTLKNVQVQIDQEVLRVSSEKNFELSHLTETKNREISSLQR